MSSLVAYEDSASDSEDEFKAYDVETSSEIIPTTSSSSSSHVHSTAPNPTSSPNTPVRLLEIQMRNAPPHRQLQASKRALPSSVRPYVPKRLRPAPPEGPVAPSDAAGGVQGEERPVLWEAAPAVKQRLCQTGPAAAADVPRRLVVSLAGHQGPVNTVKWCPVPQLSHLLLSASMDKTVKVWDGVESGRCLRLYTGHSGAVRAACWSAHGTHIVSGSFDNCAALTDVETGRALVKLDTHFRVTCVAVHPTQPEVVLCGGHDPALKAWDTRGNQAVREYRAPVQQTLDVLFLRGGHELVTSTDCVSRDSADRTLIAWDYGTAARISNQIYHERYTCPSLALHPLHDAFVAQTNGNYVALFSSRRPYKMNKRRRYEGHKVEGFAVQCAFSADGALLASGGSGGSAHFFDFHGGQMVHTLRAHGGACTSVALHPVLPSTAATCAWDGQVKVWA